MYLVLPENLWVSWPAHTSIWDQTDQNSTLKKKSPIAFIIYVSVLNMHVNAYLCAVACGCQTKVLDLLNLWVIDICEQTQHRFWEPNHFPLEEQKILLTREPSLQPPRVLLTVNNITWQNYVTLSTIRYIHTFISSRELLYRPICFHFVQLWKPSLGFILPINTA